MRWRPDGRRRGWLIARPIAHRGLHDRARGVIENSLAAVDAAIAGGYAIECDLQMSADGRPMVFHDDTLERLTDASGPVAARSASELGQLTLAGTAETIPTLDALLKRVSGRVPLIIELKSQWTGDVALAERALAGLAGYRGPHALMSFDPDLVEALRLISPGTVRGIVADRVTDAYYTHFSVTHRLMLRHMSHFDRTRPDFVSYHGDSLPCDPVRGLRASGLPVISWTIRSGAQAAHARRYSDQITFEGFVP